LPLSDELRHNDILGEKQRLTNAEQTENEIRFVWDGVVSEKGGPQDLRVNLTIRADGPRAVFSLEIDNRSPYIVENVCCPCLVDIALPQGARFLKSFYFNYDSGSERDIWPSFSNVFGYHAVDYPTQLDGYPGYQYQTGTQLLDINTKRLIPMCFGDERYMRVCEAEFDKLVELGADGMLFDECVHHGQALLCFDESHGHRYGWPVYSRDRAFIRRLAKRAPKDFVFAGEACYDWEMEAYHVSYYRSFDKRHIPLARYLQPGCQYMTAVTGFNDRNMIDQCLMFRFIISYEPYNFKGSLDDYPDTMSYGEKMDKLRTDYRKWFWDGEYMGTKGVSVLDESGAEFATFGVFRANDGSFGVVVCNYEDAAVRVKAVSEKAEFGQFRTVEDETWKPAGGWIEIPARSAVVLI
jgi:hypothetical protein